MVTYILTLRPFYFDSLFQANIHEWWTKRNGNWNRWKKQKKNPRNEYRKWYVGFGIACYLLHSIFVSILDKVIWFMWFFLYSCIDDSSSFQVPRDFGIRTPYWLMNFFFTYYVALSLLCVLSFDFIRFPCCCTFVRWNTQIYCVPD